MTKLTTEELRELLEKATPGPWSDKGIDAEGICVETDGDNSVAFIGRKGKRPLAAAVVYSALGLDRRLNANARLIAAAPDLAADRIRLEAENAALRTEVEKLRGALEYYADASCEGHTKLCGKLTEKECFGCMARAALGEGGE